MHATETIIIGGGQAGLAMSRCLTDRGVEHVILERGRVAERWRSERWDSLRLLTPRWQSRLPGWRYRGPDPDGFMTKSEVVTYLDEYARSFRAPLHTGVAVTRVHGRGDSFEVQTDAGGWVSSNVVIATGYCARAAVPASPPTSPGTSTSSCPRSTATRSSLRAGGVLVVGASATGIQLASEIARTGREVILAVGSHIRMPRHYRGRDIMRWLDEMGVLGETTDQVPDIDASRRQPSLQLIGSEAGGALDLQVLQERGVRIVGRVTGASGHRAYFSDDLADAIGHADRKMHGMLDRIDLHLSRLRLTRAFPVEPRPRVRGRAHGAARGEPQGSRREHRGVGHRLPARVPLVAHPGARCEGGDPSPGRCDPTSGAVRAGSAVHAPAQLGVSRRRRSRCRGFDRAPHSTPGPPLCGGGVNPQPV